MCLRECHQHFSPTCSKDVHFNASPSDRHVRGKKTLELGTYAGIAMLQLKEIPLLLSNVLEEKATSNHIIIPQMTVLSGRMVYCSSNCY
jgi:predicted amidohydrolase